MNEGQTTAGPWGGEEGRKEGGKGPGGCGHCSRLQMAAVQAPEVPWRISLMPVLDLSSCPFFACQPTRITPKKISMLTKPYTSSRMWKLSENIDGDFEELNSKNGVAITACLEAAKVLGQLIIL